MNSSEVTNETVPPSCVIAKSEIGKLHQPSFFIQGFVILNIIINILMVPLTAVMNTLVMIAVKIKSRLRAQKSNCILAMLALTDFFLGILAQPIFIAWMLFILLEISGGSSCGSKIFFIALTNCLFTSSLVHLALASGERYLAIKHPFQYTDIVTEARLLAASLLAWLLSVTVHILLAVNTAVFFSINSTIIGLSVTVIVFCHFSVYLETRRHEQQVAAQQVTQEARKQFEKDKNCLQTNIYYSWGSCTVLYTGNVF